MDAVSPSRRRLASYASKAVRRAASSFEEPARNRTGTTAQPARRTRPRARCRPCAAGAVRATIPPPPASGRPGRCRPCAAGAVRATIGSPRGRPPSGRRHGVKKPVAGSSASSGRRSRSTSDSSRPGRTSAPPTRGPASKKRLGSRFEAARLGEVARRACATQRLEAEPCAGSKEIEDPTAELGPGRRKASRTEAPPDRVPAVGARGTRRKSAL